MAQFREFEDMKVWQEAMSLKRDIRTVCKRPNVRRDFEWVSQISRSARSVGANIAEGSEALTTPDFINFLGIAKRSAGETRSHVYDGFDEQYLTKEERDDFVSKTKKICGMLAKLIHHLQSLDRSMKRTFSSTQAERKPINQSTNQLINNR